MKDVTTRGKTIQVPTCIDELTAGQYRYFCFLGAMLADGTLAVENWHVRWFSYLVGLKRADFTILKAAHAAELAGQMHTVTDGYLETGPDGSVRAAVNTPKNLLPECDGWHGPGDWLNGMTYGEFVTCLTIIDDIAGSDTASIVEGLKQITRVMYHIPDADDVPPLLMFHAPTLFLTVWRSIQTGPIEINGRKIDFSIIFKSTGTAKADDNTGWAGITFEIASAGVFGTVAMVEQTDMWAVLIYLYKCKFEYMHQPSAKTPAK